MKNSYWTILVLIGISVGYGLTLALLASVTGYPLDDAWIHLDYARSLLEGFTFGYTPGTWENGSTAPLWSVLVAIPLAVGVPPTLASKLVGLLALGLLTFFVYRVTVRVGGALAGAIAALLVALDPWIGVLAISGMEPIAAAAAGFAAIHFLLQRRHLASGIALAVAGLLRPEMALLLPILVISNYQRRQSGMASNSSRLWLKLIGPPVAAGGAWMLYGLMVTGRALPNAFWIKARGGLALGEQLDALRALFLAGPSIAVALVIVVIIVGLRSLRVERQHLLLALPAVTILAVYLLILPLGRDNGPLASGSAENIYYARYPLVILPWILVWIALGAVAVLNIAKNLLARWTSASAANALAMVSVLLLASFVAPSWQGHRTILAQAYRANCAEIQRTQVAMGKWIDENLDEDAVIAVSDAGAMRFYARRQEIIDLIGLNTHDMIRQADPLDWIDARGLTHVAIWPAWHQPLLHSPRWTIQVIIQMHNDQQTVVAGEYLTLYHLERRP